MVIVLRCWWQAHVGDFFTKISWLTTYVAAYQTCYQHISSPIFVTNIDVAEWIYKNDLPYGSMLELRLFETSKFKF